MLLSPRCAVLLATGAVILVTGTPTSFYSPPHRRHANFQTFLRSMSVLFRMATGESWNGIMHDTTIVADCALILRDMPEKGLKAGTYVNGPLADAPNVTTLGLVLDEDYDNQCTFHSSVSLIYFVSFVILVAFIMFNLVIAIILDNYQIISEDESLTVNRMHMERFR